jgi:hypothetical protein
MLDGPSTRSPDNFVNELHMGGGLAREIEAAIASALKPQR